MKPETCEYCGRPAIHTDSVPDANVPGCTRSEAGYRVIYLCLVHAMQRRQIATARVTPLEGVEQ